MPSIDVAMARSLRGGVWGSIAESLQSSIAPRDVVGDIKNKASDARLAFSSWDNCMQATYCKWPVIAIIVVGSLILFSIVWCIIRCACCGLSCCCDCCQCLKCCGNCCGCCDPPKGARHKYLDNETAPPNFGYKPEPPMHAPDFGPSRTTAPSSYDAPQYASFDMPKRGGEDALPTMPTWENSAAKKVATEEEEVEMNQLNKPAHTGQSVASASAAAAASAAAVAAAAGGQGGHGMSPGGYRQPSPVGPRGYAAQDPYATSAQGYGAQGYGAQGYDGHTNGGYRQPASPYGSEQFGAVAAVSAAPRRGPTPHQDYGNGYGQQQGYDAGYMDHGYTQAPQPADPYAVDPRRPSPGPGAYNSGQMRHSPAPRMGHSPTPQAVYGYPQEQQQQQFGSDAGYRQPQFRSELPDTSVNNTGGFDFTSGYSRPPAHQQYSYDRQPSPAPPQQSPSPGPARNGGFAAYTPQAS